MRSALVVALLGLPAIANAHIYLMDPPGRGEPPNGDPQKARHCGLTGRLAGRVTTLTPGATVKVTFKETINHTGWYRISFQPDGEVFRIPPMDPGAPGTYPTEDYTGMTDPDNGSIVLQDRILDTGDRLTMAVDVTLPNVECANCTLQVLSVMTGGTYNPADGGSLYFQCADLTLAANAPDAGMQVTADAGIDEGGGGSNTGYMPSEVSGGCSTGNSTGLPAALALLGLAGLRRRQNSGV